MISSMKGVVKVWGVDLNSSCPRSHRPDIDQNWGQYGIKQESREFRTFTKVRGECVFNGITILYRLSYIIPNCVYRWWRDRRGIRLSLICK